MTEKSKTLGTVSTITTETRKDKEEATQEAAASQDKRAGKENNFSRAGRLNEKLNEIEKN